MITDEESPGSTHQLVVLQFSVVDQEDIPHEGDNAEVMVGSF